MGLSKPVIYFLCTGNSCRSQMAEGFARKYLGDRFDIHSAGIEAHGVNPWAIKAMSEAGIDISAQQSSTIDQDLLRQAKYVITLCGDANDKCPATPPHVKRDHWGVEDPANVEGTEDEKWAAFQRVRDQIEENIKAFAKKVK